MASTPSPAQAPTLPIQVAPPDFAVSAALAHAVLGVEVLAFPVLPGDAEGDPLVLGPGAAELGELIDLDLLAVLEDDDVSGQPGEVTTVPVPLGLADNATVRRVLLVGVGAQTLEDLRRAGAAVARATHDRDAVATTVPAISTDEGLEAFVVGSMLGSFGFHWRSGEPPHRPVGRVVLAGLPDPQRVAPVL